MSSKTEGHWSASFAGRHGLWSSEQEDAASELLQRLTSSAVETVRIAFVDQHGMMRGKTLTIPALESALREGVRVTSTLLLKDTSHATVFPIWESDIGFGEQCLTGASDIIMLPDPLSFRELSWSPTSAWLLSDLYFTDGRPLSISCSHVARRALRSLHDINREIRFGLEVEFHVLQLDDARLSHDHAGKPEDPPLTSLLAHGYQYLTEQRYDQLEPVIDLLRRHAEALGLAVRSTEAEFGPSQIEFTFEAQTGLISADWMVMFRTMVKEVCRREGLHATFMCQPRFQQAMASGWHLHQSLCDRDGMNVFVPEQTSTISAEMNFWLAGLLSHAHESCVFTNPTVNGYKRFRAFSLAPDRAQWGNDNRGSMLRVLAEPGVQASRVENRIGEPTANPYLYMASQIISGLAGLSARTAAPPAAMAPYQSQATALPSNLGEAIEALDTSVLYRQAMGNDFVDYLLRIKRAEWQRYLSDVSEWEEREYFSLF